MLFFKNRPILVDIVVIFISLLLFITGTIIYFSYQQNKESFVKMGSEVIASEHKQVVTKLTELLSPLSFIKTTKLFTEDGILTPSELHSLSSFMHIMLAATPEFDNVYIADKEGNIFFESRFNGSLINDEYIPTKYKFSIPRNTRFVSELVYNKEKQDLIELIFKDQSGKILSDEKNIPIKLGFVPEQQPWYLGAKNNPESTWAHVINYGKNDETLIVARAVLVNGQFSGVVAIDIKLQNLDEFLQKFITGNQSIFILNENQQAIAHSVDPAHVDVDFKSACQKKPSSALNFFDERYTVHCTDFQLSGKRTWKIVSVMPVEYFIADLKKSLKKNLLLSTGLLLLGVILVVFCSRKISQPIIKLARETREMRHFQFDSAIDLKTHIYEIKVLLESIYAFRRTAKSFSKYIPKVLVEKLLDQKMIARSGGKKTELTVLFTDIEEFTHIAENVDPSFLLEHVSEYLETITSLIHHHCGTVDKYIGDSVMAFWGAPLDNERQSQDACRTVLACRRDIALLNEQWSQRGKPTFKTRFGLAKGMVVVGNVGSTDRLNYTVLGDSVNLAARLEALNKHYGVQVIVNETIYQACKQEFVFRVLDRVFVKGKSEAVLIYELIGEIPSDTQNDLQATSQQLALATQFNQAFNALERQNSEQAYELLTAIQKQYPDDVPTRLLLTRLSGLISARDKLFNTAHKEEDAAKVND